MFRTIGRSWQLVQMSWGILMRERKLLVFPVLALIGVVVVTAIFIVPLVLYGLTTGLFNQATQDHQVVLSTTQKILGVVLLFIYYLAIGIITTYTGVALAGAVLKGFAGGQPTVNDGLAVANRRLPSIIGFAAISATVGVVAALIRSVARGENDIVGQIIGRIVAGLLQATWAVTTFLAIPVMAAEGVGAITSIKHSAMLLQKTWGRQIVGNFSISAVFGLIAFGIIILGGILTGGVFSATHSVLAAGAVGVVMALILIAVILVQTALNSIYRVALYRFAYDQSVVFYNPALLQQAFRPGGRGTRGRLA
jgi:hypothetical protein